jgi:hypothetical protein
VRITSRPGNVERYLFSSPDAFGCSQLVKVVRPVPHHQFSLRQVIRIIVGGPHAVSFAMRQLSLNPVAIPIVRLVEPFGRRALARHGELEA